MIGIRNFFILILFIQALYGEGTEDCNSGFWHLKKYNFDKALYFFDKSCKSGYGRGCFELAQIYNYAKGIEADREKAYYFYKKGCNLENSSSCFYVGRFFENGIIVQRDYFKALENYGFACDNGDGSGCSTLGLLYKNGYGVNRNLDKAEEYLDKGCQLKSGVGCIELARLNLIRDDSYNSYQNAIDIYSKRCNRFYHKACLYLGEIYREEDSNFYDANRSQYFLEKACRYDNREACEILKKPTIEFKRDSFAIKTSHNPSPEEYYNLAIKYFEAKGVKQSTEKAKEYLTRACYMDLSKGCEMLGFLYEYGDKGSKDMKMANRYYRRAETL